MRILKMVLIGLAAIAFVSCQKELSVENRNGVPPPPDPVPDTLGDLLVRQVTSYTTVDSVVTQYSYDGAKRLIGIAMAGSVGSNNIDQTQTITRNGSGTITQITLLDATAGGGTLVTDVFYDAANNRYSHTIIRLNFNGTVFVDSTVFTYSTSGNISAVDDYEQDPASGTFQPYFRNEYVYAGNAVDSAKLFNADPATGAWTALSTVVYGYDSKINPLILSNAESILLTLPHLYAINNNNSQESINYQSPSSGFTMTTTFTYNSKNKPVTSVTTVLPFGAGATGAYYYQ